MVKLLGMKYLITSKIGQFIGVKMELPQSWKIMKAVIQVGLI